MKDLFIAFEHTNGIDNTIITCEKINTTEDICTLEQFIEMKGDYQKVKIINFRRVE